MAERTRGLALSIVLLLLAACEAPSSTGQPGAPTGRAVDLALGTRVTVEPSAALFTTVGQTRLLTAAAVDAGGNKVDGASSWSSSRPEVVAVSATGELTATGEGSAQIVATINGIESAPVIAVVSTPASGVTVVPDENILGEPLETDAAATPSMANTYVVRLSSGVTAAVGALLLGSGEKPLAGRVEAVTTDGDAILATMRLVPLDELLPDLELAEVIDLSTAPLQVREDVGRLYDISREGNTYLFSPKPNFADLVSAAAMRRSAVAMAGDVPLLAAATGTSALPPFTECATSTSAMPLSLEVPPLFSVEISPSVDIAWTDGQLARWLVSAAPKGTAEVGLKVAAAFEGTVTCTIELWTFRVPIAGALSFFLSGLIPVEAEAKLGGKLTVASLKIGASAEASGSATFGLRCAAGAACSFERELGQVRADLKPKVEASTLGTFRVEPKLGVAIGAGAQIGSPVMASLRLRMAKAKIGAELGADWAPRDMQIRDPEYQSSYALKLEAGVSVGSTIGDLGAFLGVAEIVAVDLKISDALARSPEGRFRADRATYVAGETGEVSVELDAESVDFLGSYNVERIVLVHFSGGADTILASVPATPGQRTFGVGFTAAGGVVAKDLHAFVVTKFPPLDAFALELGRSGGSRIVFHDPSAGIVAIDPDATNQSIVLAQPGQSLFPAISPDGSRIAYSDGDAIHVVNSDGSDPVRITDGGRFMEPAWSPDGMKIVLTSRAPGDQHGLWVVGADGSDLHQVGASGDQFPAWSPDGTTIAFTNVLNNSSLWLMQADGSNRRVLIDGAPMRAAVGAAAWSPDGTKLAYLVATGQESTTRLYVANADGSDPRVVADNLPTVGVHSAYRPAWSPDGTKIAYVAVGETGHDIYVVGVDGTGTVPLTSSQSSETHLSWSR